MYLGGILIKALSQIICSVLTFVCGFIAHKKLSWKDFEFIFVIILGIVILIYGCIDLSHAVNPEIKQVSACYSYQSGNGVIFGREYCFIDENGDVYNLTMDPITTRKIFKNKEFDKNIQYIVTYKVERIIRNRQK